MVKLDIRNPIVTVITSIIFILIVTLRINPITGIYGSVIIILFGGFIATNFAKQRRIRYGFYAGTISMAIEGISTIFMMNLHRYFDIPFFEIQLLIITLGIIIIGAVFGTIGGFIGKQVSKEEINTS